MAQLPGWILNKKITIRDTHVDSDLVDFPVYVPIKADADFHEARADGHDIRFTLSDGKTLLKYEREHWTGGNGSPATAHFWVKVPSILASGGAIIYVYYGKSDAPDGEDAPNVWDANFKGVWHLKEDSGLAIDSTGNNNNGTFYGDLPTPIDGKVYKGQDLDGVDDYVGILENLTGGLTGITLEAWVNGQQAANLFNAPPGIAILHFQGAGFYLKGEDGSVGGYLGWSPFPPLDTLVHLAATWSNPTVGDGKMKLFINGFKQATELAFNGGATEKLKASTNTSIGRYFNAVQPWFKGLIDEARISNVGRSLAWLKFEHYNINEADNEITWGIKEGVATGHQVSREEKELLLIDTKKPVFIGKKEPIFISKK